MATMEKPKQKARKPNIKQKPEVVKTNYEEEIERELATDNEISEDGNGTAACAMEHKEKQSPRELEQLETFTATTTTKEIVSHECVIAADVAKSNKSDDKENSNVSTMEDSAENISLHDELQQITASELPPVSTETWMTNLAPTAPPADVTPTTNSSQCATNASNFVIQYPNLNSLLQQVETKSPVIYKPHITKSPGFCLSNSQLKPFTDEQLKKFYDCVELRLVKQFELEFLMNSLLESYDGDPLYVAILEYYNLQSKLTINLQDIEIWRKKSLSIQDNVWVEIPITKTFSGLCGDKVEVKESITYNIAQVNGKNLEMASEALTQLFSLVCHTYTTNLVTAKVIKVKIDHIINQILAYPHLVMLAQDAQITLHKIHDAETLPCVAHLRRAISILFSFLRKLSPNENFDSDLKIWLRKLISLHLLVATKEDHWFLLFNILRCPNGVGQWATEFIQIPSTPNNLEMPATTPSGSRPSEIPLQLNSPEMNHCIATLQILLLPIKKRNDYLTAFTQSHKEISDPVKEERWILIDSDGEDSHTSSGECIGLKESDLIALLNQMPFEKVFTSALNIEKFLNDYIIEADLILPSQVLSVVAFISKLIEIFGEGMLTYNSERYKQLAKRLGRLIRHTLQYVADYHELFIHNKVSKDTLTCERISVELNALLIKACSYIYRTQNLATWQYFSSLPYSTLDAQTIWQMFYYINVGFPPQLPEILADYIDLFNAPDFWSKFNVANADSLAEDLYYLLQAFFEMANERDKVKDWDLIKTICLHIFNIGFINEPTRDVCYKTSRDMLVNLTLAYEDLMSCLLLQLKIRFSDIENAAYLFKSLPLENWKPAMESFEILSNWLLHYDFKSPENMLARIIVSHLNWSFDCDGRLFLPHNIHIRMACLITESLTKHAPEVVGLSGISESVRQVSSLIDFSQSNKEQFTSWCWIMISILRLHLMDQGVESIKRTLQNPTEHLLFIPDLERIDMIYQGVTENRPLAIYVGVLVSLHGHSIPLICQKGFELLKLLLNDYRHAAVVRCLEMIVPLFLETPETLANCESFHIILNTLFNADKTYLKMAKDMISTNSVGPVLEVLDNMIHHQITTYTDYGLSSPLNLINIWLNCLTALPNWQSSNVVYFLDKILRVAYQFPDARLQAVEYFHNYYKDCDDWKRTNKMSSLKTLFGSNPSRIPTLSPYHGWLALVLLEIEFETQDLLFWTEFLTQLSKMPSTGKVNLDTILKKTLSLLKIPTFPPQMLVIYKYANLVATMDINHSVFPILNQKFFELYLSRVTIPAVELNFGGVFGVSDKFYDYNVPLMKKIKANLKAAETFYANEGTKCASDESLSYFYRNCAKMMKTYVLWFEEPSLNRKSVEEFNYPPQYNNEKLCEIVNGNTPHWTEFIYLPSIRKEQRYQGNKWARKCYRHESMKSLRSPLPPKEHIPPIERIKMHLCSYDKNQEAPKYVKPIVNVASDINKSTLNEIKHKIKMLSSTATKFHFDTCELNSLNRNYLDTVINLYKMVSYEEIKHKSCDSLLFNRQCSSPARIVATLQSIRKEEAVVQKIQKYHDRHDKIIDQMLSFCAEDFAQSIEELGEIIRILLASQINATKRSDVVTKTGISFFYTIIENMTDINMKFQPTNDFYTQLLNELGIFIKENQEQQGLTILELALKRPDLINVLSGVFVPYCTQPEYFLKMYKFLIDSYLKHCDTKILFVLLSKFDLVSWLNTFHPKLYDITQLLQLILRGLECWSQPDSALLQHQFPRHLVHIFDHNFPQHYGEVMQMVLDRISEQKLMPVILLDLLNSLLLRFKCEAVSLDTNHEQLEEIAVEFARRQNLFNLKASTDTIMLFARHFQKERLNHGLHGLYPKHKDYCKPLSIWFSCFGHVLVVTAICTYQELLGDQISEVIFGSIIEMYSPWLITYTEQTMRQLPANWIRQLAQNDKMLHPWSAQQSKTSKIMIKPFINTLIFVLDNLPVSHKILAHTFGWYVHHFAIPKMEPYIYEPIHEGIAMLPWERFKPQENNIDMLYDSLQKFIPECHAMLGHIFIRINWNEWFSGTLIAFPVNVQAHIVSRLFTIFIKIAFEPNIHMHINTSKIIEDAINYPWHLVEYGELENLFKWILSSVDPLIILKIPTETNYADRAVLDLLRLTCAMMPEMGVYWKSAMQQPLCNATAKRILYARAFVQLLRLCASKNKKLLDTKNGNTAFNAAFIELLHNMDKAVTAIAATKTLTEQKREALNLMIEIIVPMQTQSEETSNLHIDALIKWQAQRPAANLLMCSTLSAIGHMKAFIGGIYTLLEFSIVSYFRTSEETKDWHTPTWVSLLQILQMSVDKLDLMPIIRDQSFFTLHIFILYKTEKIQNLGDKITFLQDLSQLVQNLKTNESTEQRLAIVWGAIISTSCKILSQSEHAKKPLMMLVRYLQIISTQAEGWGDGLLGAIGFKREFVTNKRKVLTRCLACVILSLFPYTNGSDSHPSEQFTSSLNELSMLLANKKFVAEKALIVKAIGIIKDQNAPNLRDVPHLICRLIAVFYDDGFLTTIPEVWDFDFIFAD